MRWVFYALLAANAAFFGWRVLVEHDVGSSRVVNAVIVDGVARIRLLEELERGTGGELLSRLVAEQCDVYGPFYSAVDSKHFLSMLEGAGFYGRAERKSVSGKLYYWGYIAPQASSREARALVNRLRGGQISAELISDGRLRWGVSLGDFESKESIGVLQRRLVKFDVLVEFERKSRDYIQFLVLLSPKGGVRMSAELRDKLIAGYPEVLHQEKVCKPVASG